MKNFLYAIILTGLAAPALAADPGLTIYNQNFAVVRDTVPLDLKAGLNEARYASATAQLEPDSVILRDPTGSHSLQILEQNYRNDPVSQELLLSLFEGKTITFQRIIEGVAIPITEMRGKIIRSGYVPGGEAQQPIIEVNGRVQFGLPGQPIFPNLGDDTVLKPTLNWQLQSDQAGKFDAEIGYVTGGFNWQADYNLVSPEKGDKVDLISWVTLHNQSGKTFENARIKLMAGDVNKIQPALRKMAPMGGVARAMAMDAAVPVVTEKSFDEFHLYTIARPATLRDREMKQVEFVRAEGVVAPTVYVYEGAAGYRFYGGLNQQPVYGADGGNKKVTVMREFVNAESNHLGMALPKGRLRFYRRDDGGQAESGGGGQLEFVGEDQIDHTPRDETIRVTTGNAFDLVGERRQTDFRTDSSNKWMDETFEIKLRNHKHETVEFRVVERLYRWSNWSITEKSDEFKKTDSQTIEFHVPVKPDEERKVTYRVHYSW